MPCLGVLPLGVLPFPPPPPPGPKMSLVHLCFLIGVCDELTLRHFDFAIQQSGPAPVKPRSTTAATATPGPLPPPPEPPVDPAWALPAITPAAIMPTLSHTQARRWKATHLYEVDEDFSARDWRDRDRERDRESVPPGDQSSLSTSRSHNKKGKEAAQVPLQTFFTAVEPYFKSITEDDLAWLTSACHEDEADSYIFDIPPLGPHYRQTWEQEAAALATINGEPPPTTPSSPSQANNKKKHSGASTFNPSFTPAALSDRSWVTDDAASGPLTQRVVASLLPLPRHRSPPEKGGPEDNKRQGEASKDDAPRSSLFGLRMKEVVPPAVTASLGQDVGTFETRLKDELDILLGSQYSSYHLDTVVGPAPSSPGGSTIVASGGPSSGGAAGFGTVSASGIGAGAGSVPNSDNPLDDEVSVTLRRVQRALCGIRTVNAARKQRLLEIAQKRMAHQEYLHGLASFEREIEQGWIKRQRQIRAQAAAGKRKQRQHQHHTQPHYPASNGVHEPPSSRPGTPLFQPSGPAVTPGVASTGAPGRASEGTAQSTAPPSEGNDCGAEGGVPLTPESLLASGGAYVVSEQVLNAIAKRTKWRAAFDALFGQDPLWFGPPPEGTSVYEDLGLNSDSFVSGQAMLPPP